MQPPRLFLTVTEIYTPEIEREPEKRLYDLRLGSDIRPQYKRIIVTDLLKKLGRKTNKFTIIIVPVLFAESQQKSIPKKDIIKFDKIGIITYD